MSYDHLLAQECLILEATELLCGAMQRQGVTRSELARRLGKTPPHITNVLSGERNMTLRTLADFAGALDLEASISLRRARRRS